MKTELIKKMTNVKISIPALDGKTVAEVIEIKVPCLENAATGEEFLESEAMNLMDQAKARYMGLMLPAQIKQLRVSLGLTQKEMCDLLQIGDKSYSRWETGKDRQSRLTNLLLQAIADGKVTPGYLKSKQGACSDWWALAIRRTGTSEKRKAYTVDVKDETLCSCMEEGVCYETKQFTA